MGGDEGDAGAAERGGVGRGLGGGVALGEEEGVRRREGNQEMGGVGEQESRRRRNDGGEWYEGRWYSRTRLRHILEYQKDLLHAVGIDIAEGSRRVGRRLRTTNLEHDLSVDGLREMKTVSQNLANSLHHFKASLGTAVRGMREGPDLMRRLRAIESMARVTKQNIATAERRSRRQKGRAVRVTRDMSNVMYAARDFRERMMDMGHEGIIYRYGDDGTNEREYGGSRSRSRSPRRSSERSSRSRSRFR